MGKVKINNTEYTEEEFVKHVHDNIAKQNNKHKYLQHKPNPQHWCEVARKFWHYKKFIEEEKIKMS